VYKNAQSENIEFTITYRAVRETTLSAASCQTLSDFTMYFLYCDPAPCKWCWSHHNCHQSFQLGSHYACQWCRSS